jgi:hypothetical protein
MTSGPYMVLDLERLHWRSLVLLVDHLHDLRRHSVSVIHMHLLHCS